MRDFSWCLVLGLAGCGTVKGAPGADAGPDAAIDAAPDAAPPCGPTTLLAGGNDLAAQGWTVTMQAPATVTNGLDYVRLETSSAVGARVGGQLLLSRAGAVTAGAPFKLQVVMMVESVTPHNAFDSAAAILGAFTAPFGTGVQREQMIYLDGRAVGWADDTQSYAVTVLDGAYHTYELSVDASNVARLTIDGAQALMRTGFVSNGTIALGDQTNDLNVDSALRIRSVTKLCL